MAEVEIHTEHGHASDPFAQRVGMFVGIIGIVLAVVTILSHREHTEAVVHKTEANDQWSYFEAKKSRGENEEIGADLMRALASDQTKVQPLIDKYNAAGKKHAEEAATIKASADEKEAESSHSERRALRFDLAEGLLELGLVMSSLFFLSKRQSFVYFGLTAAVIGAIIGVLGLLA